jgi:hypothetical protein
LSGTVFFLSTFQLNRTTEPFHCSRYNV